MQSILEPGKLVQVDTAKRWTIHTTSRLGKPPPPFVISLDPSLLPSTTKFNIPISRQALLAKWPLMVENGGDSTWWLLAKDRIAVCKSVHFLELASLAYKLSKQWYISRYSCPGGGECFTRNVMTFVIYCAAWYTPYISSDPFYFVYIIPYIHVKPPSYYITYTLPNFSNEIQNQTVEFRMIH